MSERTILEAAMAAGGNTIAALAVKATLALAGALLLIRLARGASASMRHLLAAATFAVLLLLPLAATVIPAQVIRLAPPPAEPRPVPAMASQAVAARPDPGVGAPVTATKSRRAAFVGGLYVAYLMGAVGLVAWLLTGMWRVGRLRRRAEVSVAGTRLANAIAHEEGMPAGTEVAVSSELAVPVTFGWTHPVILLPAETREWDEQQLGRAIRHELEHIARGDWATHVVSRMALALYWPHPLAWALWRRLRLEAERACDDAVLRSQGQAEPYAEQLVWLARRLSARGGVPALSMAARSHLGVRVDAILDGGLRRAPRSRFASFAVSLAAAACLLSIAPFQVTGAAAPAAEPEELEGGRALDVALLEAAGEGDLGRMRQLLDRGAAADAAVPGDGSPLIAAARRGRLEAVEMLIAEGANVNRGVRGDGNPLLNAAREGHLEAVRLLLERGADIDAGVPGDGNALIMAAGAGRIDVVRFLLDKGAALEKVVPGDENPLIHASEGGQAQVVRLLIDRGADVNARVWAAGPQGGRGEWRTALLMARRNGHAEVVGILQAAGARE